MQVLLQITATESTHTNSEHVKKTVVRHVQKSAEAAVDTSSITQPITTQFTLKEAYCTHSSVKEEYQITLKEVTLSGVDTKIQFVHII